jgi:hemoglobin-like flavoprotein
MTLDIAALRHSFELVLDRRPDLTARFYQILFERYPQVRPMFGGAATRRQEEMLARALVLVVDHLEDGDWLSRTLAELGARHAGYGVTAEMYDWVGDALLATLAEAAGADWTPHLASQWASAYGTICQLMQAGEQTRPAAAQVG